MEVRDEDFDNVDAGEPRFLIPDEGWYPAQLSSYETKRYGGWGNKLIFRWKVFTSKDKTAFKLIPRYYNYERDGGGRFRFGPLHAYRRDWIAANGGRHPINRSKLPCSILKTGLFLVEVVTVRTDNERRPLPSTFHWSKIGRVIRPFEEGESWERLPVQLLDSQR